MFLLISTPFFNGAGTNKQYLKNTTKKKPIKNFIIQKYLRNFSLCTSKPTIPEENINKYKQLFL